jgi:hypothetical protein
VSQTASDEQSAIRNYVSLIANPKQAQRLFMFIGHFALGFAAKRIAPRSSLATTFTAAQLADVLWPFFLLLGIERVTIAPGATAFTPLRFDSYPVSHSLVALLAWGAGFGALVWFARRDRASALTCAALVVSHWLLDFVTHRPDMPLVPGVPLKLGLGMWNSVPLTIVVESVLFAWGIWLYVRTTRARNRVGTYGLVALLVLLLAAYAGAILGPPPPDITTIAVTGIVGAAFILGVAIFVDKHREAR